MTRGNENARRLFGKVVHQSPLFTRRIQGLNLPVVETIVETTAIYYPRFERLAHGIVVGQLSEDVPPGYEGPPLQFAYKVLSDKVAFLDLALGGFDAAHRAGLEKAYDL